jgi:hypothetical protein
MKGFLLKVWKDPVWSKVISAGIIGGSILIWSSVDNVSFMDKIRELYNLKVKLVYVLLVLLILGVIRYLIKILNRNVLNKKQLELQQFNKLSFNHDTILAKWETSFQDNQPIVKNVVLYCNKHTPPIKLHRGECTVMNCPNKDMDFETALYRKIVESHVEDEWEKLNK